MDHPAITNKPSISLFNRMRIDHHVSYTTHHSFHKYRMDESIVNRMQMDHPVSYYYVEGPTTIIKAMHQCVLCRMHMV